MAARKSKKGKKAQDASPAKPTSSTAGVTKKTTRSKAKQATRETSAGPKSKTTPKATPKTTPQPSSRAGSRTGSRASSRVGSRAGSRAPSAQPGRVTRSQSRQASQELSGASNDELSKPMNTIAEDPEEEEAATSQDTAAHVDDDIVMITDEGSTAPTTEPTSFEQTQTVTDAQELVQESVQETVQETVQESVQESVQETVQEPVDALTSIEIVHDTVEDYSIDRTTNFADFQEDGAEIIPTTEITEAVMAKGKERRSYSSYSSQGSPLFDEVSQSGNDASFGVYPELYEDAQKSLEAAQREILNLRTEVLCMKRKMKHTDDNNEKLKFQVERLEYDLDKTREVSERYKGEIDEAKAEAEKWKSERDWWKAEAQGDHRLASEVSEAEKEKRRREVEKEEALEREKALEEANFKAAAKALAKKKKEEEDESRRRSTSLPTSPATNVAETPATQTGFWNGSFVRTFGKLLPSFRRQPNTAPNAGTRTSGIDINTWRDANGNYRHPISVKPAKNTVPGNSILRKGPSTRSTPPYHSPGEHGPSSPESPTRRRSSNDKKPLPPMAHKITNKYQVRRRQRPKTPAELEELAAQQRAQENQREAEEILREEAQQAEVQRQKSRANAREQVEQSNEMDEHQSGTEFHHSHQPNSTVPSEGLPQSQKSPPPVISPNVGQKRKRTVPIDKLRTIPSGPQQGSFCLYYDLPGYTSGSDDDDMLEVDEDASMMTESSQKTSSPVAAKTPPKPAAPKPPQNVHSRYSRWPAPTPPPAPPKPVGEAAVEKARESAEKHKPKTPSRLRTEERMSMSWSPETPMKSATAAPTTAAPATVTPAKAASTTVTPAKVASTTVAPATAASASKSAPEPPSTPPTTPPSKPADAESAEPRQPSGSPPLDIWLPWEELEPKIKSKLLPGVVVKDPERFANPKTWHDDPTHENHFLRCVPLRMLVGPEIRERKMELMKELGDHYDGP